MGNSKSKKKPPKQDQKSDYQKHLEQQQQQRNLFNQQPVYQEGYVPMNNGQNKSNSQPNQFYGQQQNQQFPNQQQMQMQQPLMQQQQQQNQIPQQQNFSQPINNNFTSFNPFQPYQSNIQIKEYTKPKAKLDLTKEQNTGLDMPNMYLFGISNEDSNPQFHNPNTGPSIIKFDPRQKTLTRQTVPPEMKVLNYMEAVYINEKMIYVTGGINKALSKISKKSYIYNPQQVTCQLLPDMIQARYTHISAFQDNQLYCFGGRFFGKGASGILKACEYFDFNKWRWFEMCPMIKRRCTGNAIIYGGEIYVFGGYTGDRQRNRVIEKYAQEIDQWVEMDFELPQGIEASVLVPSLPNEILIIGGTKQDGATNSVYNLNLKNLTLGSYPDMIQKRSLAKGFLYQGIIYIFGGNTQDDVETFDYAMHAQTQQCKSWKKSQISYKQIVNTEVSMKSFSQSHPSHVISYMDNQQNSFIQNPEYVFFGMDNHRIIVKIQVKNQEYRMEKVDPPLSLLLLGYMGGTKLGQNVYFLAGGLSSTRKRISRDAYVYNAQTNTVEKKEQMLDLRYTFPMAYIHPYAYAIGGRAYGSKQISILRSCERFNLETNEWERIGSMKFRRCTASLTVHQGKLYCFGGFQIPNKRIKEVEMFNSVTNRWYVLDFKTSTALEAAPVIQVDHNDYICLGGKSQKGYEKTIYKVNFGHQNKFKSCGQLLESKCLHKAMYLGNSQILIFGGTKYPVEVFNYKTGKNVKNHPCIAIFKNQITYLDINKDFKHYLIC